MEQPLLLRHFGLASSFRQGYLAKPNPMPPPGIRPLRTAAQTSAGRLRLVANVPQKLCACGQGLQTARCRSLLSASENDVVLGGPVGREGSSTRIREATGRDRDSALRILDLCEVQRTQSACADRLGSANFLESSEEGPRFLASVRTRGMQPDGV